MIVDFHTHYVPQVYPPRPDGVDEPAWPRMEPSEKGAKMYVGDRLFRVFESFYWDIPARLAVMDEFNIDVQVISPLPELLSYWLDPRAAAVLTDTMNAHIADAVGQSGGRMRGLGIVALQDIRKAVAQVEAIAGLGLSGVFVGSHINGKSIASPDFDPFFAACEANDLLVFCHGIKPGGLERLSGPGMMASVIGIPHENSVAIANFITRDILGQFPRLKLVFSHGGGGISAVIDRMDLVWNMFPVMRETLKIAPSEYARRFWYDTAVFGEDYLVYLVKQFGADRIIGGTDGPTDVGERDIGKWVAGTELGADDAALVTGGSAARLLGL